MLEQLGVELDGRGNVKTDVSKMTSVPECSPQETWREASSLVVWAIAEGRQAAHGIDAYLMGATALPFRGPTQLVVAAPVPMPTNPQRTCGCSVVEAPLIGHGASISLIEHTSSLRRAKVLDALKATTAPNGRHSMRE